MTGSVNSCAENVSITNMKYFKPILFATVCVFAAGCYYDSEQSLYPNTTNNNNNNTTCDTTNVTYSATIVPILTSGGSSSCYSCHAADTYVSLGGNIELDGYANLKIYASNGRLLGAMTHTSGYSSMPKNLPQLSSCDIAKVRVWVRSGIANN